MADALVAPGQRRQETCATPTAACHNVAAEPFRLETVSTIKEINYFRYNVNECERDVSAGWAPTLGKCAHTSAQALFGAWGHRIEAARVTCHKERATNLLQLMRGCNSKCASFLHMQ